MASSPVKSVPGLKNEYNACSKEVQQYFNHIPKLLDDFPLEVCLAYVFSRLELGQNIALYCGTVKIHKVDASLARTAITKQHIIRESFVSFYKTIFGIDLPQKAHENLVKAGKTRDKVMHGKETTAGEMRTAIFHVLEFAEEINIQLSKTHNLRPFGNITGFAGASKKLEKGTSKFILKGIGFNNI